MSGLPQALGFYIGSIMAFGYTYNAVNSARGQRAGCGALAMAGYYGG